MIVSDDFNIAFATADQVEDDMEITNRRMVTELEAMIAKVDGTTAEWTGEAKEQYAIAKDVWRSSSAEMNNALAQAKAALQSIKEGYSLTEMRNAQNFSNTR